MNQRPWPQNFTHRMTHAMPTRAAAWSERWWFFKEHWLSVARRHDVPAILLPPPLRELDCTHETRLTWIGHASYVLQTGGQTLLIDPVWSNQIAGGIRRLAPPGIPWHGIPKVDAVLITHNHFDHLDAPTIQRLPKATAFFVPAGLGRWFTRRGFTCVTELDWWETADHAGLAIEFVPAHHWSRRGIFDTNRSLWGGWVVSTRGGPKVYFSGDTAYGDFFRQIGERHPSIDAAVLPIGAYAPRATNGNAHTDPEEALAAFHDLRAKAMVPMHWATFRLGSEPVLEPMQRLEAAWNQASLAREALWSMAIGETRAIAAPGGLPCRCQQVGSRMPMEQRTAIGLGRPVRTSAPRRPIPRAVVD